MAYPFHPHFASAAPPSMMIPPAAGLSFHEHSGHRRPQRRQHPQSPSPFATNSSRASNTTWFSTPTPTPTPTPTQPPVLQEPDIATPRASSLPPTLPPHSTTTATPQPATPASTDPVSSSTPTAATPNRATHPHSRLSIVTTERPASVPPTLPSTSTSTSTSTSRPSTPRTNSTAGRFTPYSYTCAPGPAPRKRPPAPPFLARALAHAPPVGFAAYPAYHAHYAPVPVPGPPPMPYSPYAYGMYTPPVGPPPPPPSSSRFARSAAKLKSTNNKPREYCRYYHLWGKSKCRNATSCPHLHVPSRVRLCPTLLFPPSTPHLPAACDLTHVRTDNNTPHCTYFLTLGACHRAQCAFMHVKLGAEARACAAFDTWQYCERGRACGEVHALSKVDPHSRLGRRLAEKAAKVKEDKYSKRNGSSGIGMEGIEVPDYDEDGQGDEGGDEFIPIPESDDDDDEQDEQPGSARSARGRAWSVSVDGDEDEDEFVPTPPSTAPVMVESEHDHEDEDEDELVWIEDVEPMQMTVIDVDSDSGSDLDSAGACEQVKDPAPEPMAESSCTPTTLVKNTKKKKKSKWDDAFF